MMRLKIKFYLLRGVIWVFKTLRIITHEDAENHFNLLIICELVEDAREREREYRGLNR